VVGLGAFPRTTTAAKQVQATLGADMLADWSQLAPTALLRGFMRAYSRVRGADRHPAPFNVVVSNVPGPREPVSFAGARLTELYSVGPILEGIALNVTVWSYVDQMHFSLLTCPDNLPDLRAVATRLKPALDDLLAAAL
jgi:diacylglycerol O-acyltransferase